VAGIEEVAVEPGGAVLAPAQPVVASGGVGTVLVEDVVGVGRGSVAGAPDDGGGDPGLDLDARLAVVGAVDEVGQGIEAGGEARVLGARFEAPGVESIAAPTHLDEQGVDVGAAGVGEEAVDLGGRLEAIAVAIDPEAAELGRRAAAGEWRPGPEELGPGRGRRADQAQADEQQDEEGGPASGHG
jgi:hypothetical protein